MALFCDALLRAMLNLGQSLGVLSVLIDVDV
jgi:hypothetical protein